MIGTKSRSICVKFREDDPNQMEAWHYLQNERGARTYAELIADMVKERNREQSDGLLAEIRHICLDIKDRVTGCAFSPTGISSDEREKREEKMTHKGEITDGVADLMRQLSGEDED